VVLLHDPVAVVAVDDPLDVRVLVPRCDQKPVAAAAHDAVLRGGDFDSLDAVGVGALADGRVEAILERLPGSTRRSIRSLISRNALSLSASRCLRSSLIVLSRPSTRPRIAENRSPARYDALGVVRVLVGEVAQRRIKILLDQQRRAQVERSSALASVRPG
jgi:hypothetical protein